MIEVFVIIVLLFVLFNNLEIFSPNTYTINSNSSSLIYSKDKSTPFTGRMQDTVDSRFIVQFNVVDGIKQGEFIMLTMDGNFAVTGFMKENKNDGNWKYFYQNGQVECAGNYSDDEPIGKWEWYYQSGVKKSEGIFLHGKPNGRWLRYNQEGVLDLIINYQQGEIINLVQLENLKEV